MNFKVDKENRKIHVDRVYDAPVDKVWAAWTKPELTDQWWAPKPWKAETKKMDFREGGHWLYSMNGPEGEKHWARFDFKNIEPNKSFSGDDSFTDADGNINNSPEFPSSHWKTNFTGKGDKTQVDVELSFDDEKAMDNMLKTGFKEGFEAGLGNLDEVLAKK